MRFFAGAQNDKKKDEILRCAQNDNIIVVVFNEGKRFFAALRMTIKKGAQNDNVTGWDSSLRSEWQKKGAQNDKKKGLRMTPKLLIVILNVVKDLDFDG